MTARRDESWGAWHGCLFCVGELGKGGREASENMIEVWGADRAGLRRRSLPGAVNRKGESCTIERRMGKTRSTVSGEDMTSQASHCVRREGLGRFRTDGGR